jgi:hypothetical protein
MIAQFAEKNFGQPTNSVQDIAVRFAQYFWPEYMNRTAAERARLVQLATAPTLTPPEEEERRSLAQNLAGGFCLGGNLYCDRTPAACEILYEPLAPGPVVNAIPMGVGGFWGVKNLILRMFYGIDPELYSALLKCGHWTGTPIDLANLVNPYKLLAPGHLPLRDAIDWVHASVYATIKAMKFSQLAPVCGGPVEIAVVTADRAFRWVRHKKLDTAIRRGGIPDANP